MVEIVLKASLSPGRSNKGWFSGDGFIVFLLLQQMGWGWHGPQIEGHLALLLFTGSRPALGSLPSVVLSILRWSKGNVSRFRSLGGL
jgi:hypothetical protein